LSIKSLTALFVFSKKKLYFFLLPLYLAENLLAALVGLPWIKRSLVTCLVATFFRRRAERENSRFTRPKGVVEKRTDVDLQRLNVLMRRDPELVVCVNQLLYIYKFKLDEESQLYYQDDDEEELDGVGTTQKNATTIAADNERPAKKKEIGTFLVCPKTLYCLR
jgi:hypothetical protein